MLSDLEQSPSWLSPGDRGFAGYRPLIWPLEQLQQPHLQVMFNRIWPERDSASQSPGCSQGPHPKAMPLTTHVSAGLLLWEVSAGTQAAAQCDLKYGVRSRGSF